MSTVTTASATREHRVTVRSLALRKRKAEPFTMLTAYDFTFARIFDEAGVDVLLVGDSLGNVVQGHDTTLPVTVDEVVYHTRLVARGVRRAMVVADMPFGSYQVGPEDAVRTAIRLVKEGGAHAVKLEGGVDVADSVRRIVAAQIPLMGHVGLTPQSVHALGGFRTQGRSPAEAARILADAEAIAGAGAFAVVVEATVEPVARAITERIAVPTIGIGASPACDGQILVTEDLLGLTGDMAPRFAKRYAAVGEVIAAAIADFGEDVRERRFPGKEHCVDLVEAPS